jgi:hypothetical protein
MQDGHIERHLAAVEEVGDLMEKNGNIVRPAVVDGLSVGGADKQGVVTKVPFHLRLGEGVVTQEKNMDKLDLVQLVFAQGEGLHQMVRRRGVAADIDSILTLDLGDCFFSSAQLFLVIVDPTHNRPPLAKEVNRRLKPSIKAIFQDLSNYFI